MKKLALGTALAAALVSNAALAELAIIGHPGINLRGVSNDELSKVYLGNSSSLGGVSVKPVDQDPGSRARAQFYDKVVGQSEAQLKRYWSQRMFSGKGKPPPSLAGDEAVRNWVATTPGGIGYVDGSAVDGSVKVLSIIP
ncbi:MAG TPA: phosphate ABC transporter substrate-binding protein [Thioalkalivibrio sp.]|nr:phosphate ABC transporter substrate-binding protein [Thioalkalivibrio sp.]